jgi:hypothetical protein
MSSIIIDYFYHRDHREHREGGGDFTGQGGARRDVPAARLYGKKIPAIFLVLVGNYYRYE